MSELHVFQSATHLWVAEVDGGDLGYPKCMVPLTEQAEDEFVQAENLALDLERLARQLRMSAARKVCCKR